jgi:hypothetical protein
MNDAAPIKTAGKTRRPSKKNNPTPITKARDLKRRGVSINGPIGRITILAMSPPNIA